MLSPVYCSSTALARSQGKRNEVCPSEQVHGITSSWVALDFDKNGGSAQVASHPSQPAARRQCSAGTYFLSSINFSLHNPSLLKLPKVNLSAKVTTGPSLADTTSSQNQILLLLLLLSHTCPHYHSQAHSCPWHSHAAYTSENSAKLFTFPSHILWLATCILLCSYLAFLFLSSLTLFFTWHCCSFSKYILRFSSNLPLSYKAFTLCASHCVLPPFPPTPGACLWRKSCPYSR